MNKLNINDLKKEMVPKKKKHSNKKKRKNITIPNWTVFDVLLLVAIIGFFTPIFFVDAKEKETIKNREVAALKVEQSELAQLKIKINEMEKEREFYKDCINESPDL